MSTPSPILLTEAALKRLLDLLVQRKACGVRLRLRARGCSGMSYVMEYVDTPFPGDHAIPLKESGESLFIQNQALLFLVGTEMDYQETPVRSGFIFKNPHEKGRCGCGASFHV